VRRRGNAGHLPSFGAVDPQAPGIQNGFDKRNVSKRSSSISLDGERAGLPPLPTMRLGLFNSEAKPTPAAQPMHAIIRQAIKGLGEEAGRR
jgi:hypothetical protein